MGNCANNVFVPEEEIRVNEKTEARPAKKRIFGDNGEDQSKFDFHADLNTLTHHPKIDTQQSLVVNPDVKWSGSSSSCINLETFVYFNPLGVDYGPNNTVKGAITLASGDIYVGEWNDEGIQNGKGTLLAIDGGKYEGFWLEGQKHGYGREYFANGDVYEGEWISGHIKGKGTYYRVDGEKIAGIWMNENLTGKGGITGKFKYEGEITNGIPEGKGKILFNDLSSYEGDFSNGQPHGFGIKHWEGKSKIYKGQFYEGKMEGQGTFTWENGDSYTGGYSKNKKHGFGVMKWKSQGISYEGEWANGLQNGEGKLIYESGEDFPGKWKQGKKIS